MQKCATCDYRTTNPKQMQKHVEKTRHGQQAPKKENRSHLRTVPIKQKK